MRAPLGIAWEPRSPLRRRGNDDEAGYSFFFGQFLANLEEAAKSLDDRVVEEMKGRSIENKKFPTQR